MAAPIWKDYFVNLGTGTSEVFNIVVDGTTIYSGKAYKRPGESTIRVKVNDIIADYFQRNIPAFLGDYDSCTLNTGKVLMQLSSQSVSAYEIFFNDWSYEDTGDTFFGTSAPIDGWISPNQHLLYSDNGSAEAEFLLTYSDQHPDFQPWEGPGVGSFNDDFLISGTEETFTIEGDGDMQIYSLYLGQFIPNLAGVQVAGKSWRMWPGCTQYALHYINAFGGWDSFLIRGNTKVSDSLKHYERTGDYSNDLAYNRGRETYVNEVTRKFVFHTGMLTEAQAARMHHLLKSTWVYVEDLASGDFFPVVLTGSTYEYKTYRNNGNKLIEYAIEAELSQERIRR